MTASKLGGLFDAYHPNRPSPAGKPAAVAAPPTHHGSHPAPGRCRSPRGVHLRPGGGDRSAATWMQLLVVPALSATGLFLWKQAQLRRAAQALSRQARRLSSNAH
ncbi:MAG: hypothetical protein ACRDRG_00275 [Pseudonocardiaceae bacterium]